FAGLEKKRVKAFVLMAGLPSVSDSMGSRLKDRLSKEDLAAYVASMAPLDAVRYVGGAASSPVFLQFARRDEYISQEDAQRYSEAVSEPKRIEWYDAGHELGPVARRDREEWIRTALGLNSEGYMQVAEGVRLHYRKVGEGPQTVVIPWVSLSQVDDLAPLAEGRTLIFYAPRGRLRSDTVDPSRISFENEISDLETVRRHFGLEKMALLGWSHYGMMTATYTLRYPERVTRLVQMVPASPRSQPYLAQGMQESRSRVDGAAWNELQKKREAGAFANDPAASCRAEKTVMLPVYFGDRSLAAKVPLDDCDLPNERSENQAKVWTALFASIRDWDLRGGLRDLRVPRLVVAGEKDFIPMAASREWVAGMPEARLLILRGVGHFPHVEAREIFLGAIDTFLDGGWPAGAEALPAEPATGSR
ncbi:MAG TPA: alpha/beta hydrolase, partial [Thermoanaerobaculia bacterium]|nr:alpha/beta hydrolase [Thermoanaerobaculia bacterium]